MSAQVPESLRYQGETMPMCTNPLDLYFTLAGIEPDLQTTSTALWRGYLGQWEVTGNRLYLIGLQGKRIDGSPATVASFFPGYGDRVFAHWFTGTLRMPQGRPLRFVPDGYETPFERDLLLTVRRGMVTGKQVRKNGNVQSLRAPAHQRAVTPSPSAAA